MSDPVIISIVVAASTCVQALIATLNHASTKKAVREVEEKVEDTHTAINGRMTELLVATNAQGRQEQRAETRQDAKDGK